MSLKPNILSTVIIDQAIRRSRIGQVSIHLAFSAVLLSFQKRIKGLPLLFKAPNTPLLLNPDVQEDEPEKVTQSKHSINCHYCQAQVQSPKSQSQDQKDLG